MWSYAPPHSLYVYTRFVYIFTYVCKQEFSARTWRGLHSLRVDIELSTRNLNPCILQYLSLSEWVCSRVGIIQLQLQPLYFTVLEPLGVGLQSGRNYPLAPSTLVFYST
jgi:hypothetical protein